MVLLSLVLMFADSRFDYLAKVRFYSAVLVTPVYVVAAIPARISEWGRGAFASRNELLDANSALQDQLLETRFRLQKLEHLSAENRRLNALLNASSDVPERVVRAQLMGESPDPFSKRILINRGANDDVYVGQPVLDADGLMGQVTEVQSLQSWVLLITDPQHSTPIQVNRNGIRAVASGTRDTLHALTLVNVPNTADIREGDLLVTSGLGQRFPAGYPVGVVSSVRVDTGKPFAEVLVQPTASIDRSRNLLLVFAEAPDAAALPTAPADGSSELPGGEEAAAAEGPEAEILETDALEEESVADDDSPAAAEVESPAGAPL